MLRCSPLFSFQEYIAAKKEIKMLELETLLMLVNILCYTSMAPDFQKMGKVILKIILEKIFKF